MGVIETLALVRRYAEAIAEGRIEARAVKNMTDEELAAFDEQLSTQLAEKQREAENLAKGETDSEKS